VDDRTQRRERLGARPTASSSKAAGLRARGEQAQGKEQRAEAARKLVQVPSPCGCGTTVALQDAEAGPRHRGQGPPGWRPCQ